ncbi:MAG: CBS domain-containing protein [Candidatus Dadabacteria bacterium]|nr:MAG: CBS domain-containing protein [Candidatus Dadabacteria bacterium]
MNTTIKIKDVMTPDPHTIAVDQTLKKAKEVMKQHGIRHLPVRDGEKLTGIITERDINFGLAIELKHDYELLVSDVVLPDPYTVTPDTPLAEVAEHMARDYIGSTLILDGEKLVGIFTTVDACRALAKILRGEKINTHT